MPNHNRLVWIDLEMTGLDPEQERIIEMATIITDSELNLVAEGPVIAIHQPDSLLDAMDEWCTNTHGASGLTQRVKDSKTSEAEAEQETLAFLKQYLSAGESPLCGNSIGQDRRWRPEVLDGGKKKGCHLALDDIRDSIEELRHYREHFFKL